MNKNKTQPNVEIVKAKIAHVGNTIRYLSQIYGQDWRHYLKELVDNGLDGIKVANDTGLPISGSVDVELYRGPKEGGPSILVLDNGSGMTKDELNRLPTQIGLSIKADPEYQKRHPSVIGHKAIGFWAWPGLGRQVTVYSRKFGSKEVNCFIAGIEDLEDPEPKFKIIGPMDYTLSVPSGTHVYISKLHDYIAEKISAKRFAEYCTIRYRSDLLSGIFKLTIIEGDNKIEVRPYQYKGEKFKKSVSTPRGPVDFEIWVSRAETDQKVMLRIKGVPVVTDVTTIDDLRHEPWTLDRVYGEMRCNFLKVLPSRTGIDLTDESYKEWFRAVQKAEPKVKKFAADVLEDLEKKAADDMYRDIMRKVNQMFSRTDFALWKAAIKRKLGKQRLEMAPEGDIMVFEKTKRERDDDGGGKGGRHRGGGGGRYVGQGQENMSSDMQANPTMRVRLLIDYEDNADEAWRMSRMEKIEGIPKVWVNRVNSNYGRAKREGALTTYISYLAGKELLVDGMQDAPTDELADHLTGLFVTDVLSEIRRRKHARVA